MTRRRHHVPWKTAGTHSERTHSVNDVVREQGWLFNNQRGEHLDLEAFVATGNDETLAYLQAFGLAGPQMAEQTLVEIGSGIGRMTSSFTHHFRRVVACDLDAAFLERCRETVATFGRPDRLQTLHVTDGHTLHLPDATADLAFSYITLQHCSTADALALTAEAVRVTKPGGRVALNYRTWTAADGVLWPGGKIVRASWRLPSVGRVLSRQRALTRLGWQANRLRPSSVLNGVAERLVDVTVYRSPSRRPFSLASAADGTFEGVHRSHWWLVGTVR